MKKVLSWLLCFGILVSCMAPSVSKAEESQVTVDENEVADSMYSDDAFYALNNCDNELFSYDRGCFTVKKKFMDVFVLSTTNATPAVTDSKSNPVYINDNKQDVYVYDNATGTYHCDATGDTKYTMYATDFGEWADEMAAFKLIRDMYYSGEYGMWSFTVEDGVKCFPSFQNLFNSQFVRYIKVPESVTELSDNTFRYLCIYKVFMESSSITEIPDRCFFATNIMFSDWSKLDGKITKIGDYAFYQLNTSSNFTGQFRDWKTKLKLNNDYTHVDFVITLPKFNAVETIGNVPFMECTLDNTVIDFSNNDKLEYGYDKDQKVPQPSDTYTVNLSACSMFYGVKCKQILLKNCSKLQNVGVIGYVDTELLDMSGCNNIYVLYMPQTAATSYITKVNVNGFANRAGFSNGCLYYSRINEVKLPESCISLQDYAIYDCVIGKINLENVRFLRGPWYMNTDGRSFHTNVNEDSLFDRTDIPRLQEMDLSGVQYFNSYYDIFSRNFNAEFGKEYDGNFVFKAPKNLVWFSPQRNFGGYALYAQKDSIGAYILKELQISKSSGNIILPFANVNNNIYGFSLVPAKGYADSSLSNDVKCSWSDVNVSVFAKIYKDGIDAFTKSFNPCDSPTDNGKSVFVDQFYNYSDSTLRNGYGRALVIDEKTNMSDNYNAAMKTAGYRYTENGTKELTYEYPTLLYLKDEFMTKIDTVESSKSVLLDLSKEGSITDISKLKSALTVYGDYYDGKQRKLTDYTIQNITYQNDTLDFDIEVDNLPKTYDVSSWYLNSDSDMFKEGYDFTTRTKHVTLSVKPEVDVKVYGNKSVKQGKTAEYNAHVATQGDVSDTSVVWSVSGNTSADTVISQDGLLTVDLQEKAKELTITATSVFDATKSDSITVKVVPVTTGIEVTGRSLLMPNAKATYSFVAKGTVDVPQNVVWSVSGNTDADTKINQDGLLSLGTNEKSKVLTVQAVHENHDDVMTYTKEVSICYDILGPDAIKVKDSASYHVGEFTGVNTEWIVTGNTSADTMMKHNALQIGSDETADFVQICYRNADDVTEQIKKTISVKQYIADVHVYGDSSIQKGKQSDYKAFVKGSDGADKGIVWSIEGNTSNDTKVLQNGKLTVSKDETAKNVLVCATSVFDSEKSDAKSVDILDEKSDSKPVTTPTPSPSVTPSPEPTPNVTPTVEPTVTPESTSDSVKVEKVMRHSIALKKVINKGSRFEMKLFKANKHNKIEWSQISGTKSVKRKGNVFYAKKKGKAVYRCSVYDKSSKCIYRFKVTFVVKNSKTKTLNTSTNLLKTMVPCLLFDKDVSMKKGMKLQLPKGMKASYSYSGKQIRVKNNRIYGKKKGYAYIKIILKDGSKRYTYRMHLHFV